MTPDEARAKAVEAAVANAALFIAQGKMVSAAIEAAIETYEASLAENDYRLEPDWEDISTAPKDKPSRIDLWSEGMRFMDCYWDRICQEYRTTGSTGLLQRIKKATHWRRSPAPPQEPGDG